MSNAWRCSRSQFFILSSVALFASGAYSLRGADRLQQIKERGELLWGADAEGGAPYVYPDPQKPEQLIGFEYELAESLARRLGVKARIVQNQWDQLIPALERGNFDIILNGLELTVDNQQRIAMSRPYFVYAQQIVTRKETQGLARLDELKGKVVGVLSSSVAEHLLEQAGGTQLKVYPGNVESLRCAAKIHTRCIGSIDRRRLANGGKRISRLIRCHGVRAILQTRKGVSARAACNCRRTTRSPQHQRRSAPSRAWTNRPGNRESRRRRRGLRKVHSDHIRTIDCCAPTGWTECHARPARNHRVRPVW